MQFVNPVESNNQFNNANNNSYSNLFLRKKENQSNKKPSCVKRKIPDNKATSVTPLSPKKGKMLEKRIEEGKNSNENSQREHLVGNFNNNSMAKNISNPDSFEMSNISHDKVLSPKSDYKFNNPLYKQPSTQKVVKNKRSISSSSKNSQCGQTSVEMYMQRRHSQTLQKLQTIKNDLLDKETQHLQDKPKISKQSKKIVERLVQNNQNVVERLTSSKHSRKREECQMKVRANMDKNKNRPSINKSSGKLQRTIDDLYYWQNALDRKKEEEVEDQKNKVFHRLK